jgi:hypothetical protein
MKRPAAGLLIGILLSAGMAMGGPSFARAGADGFGDMEIVPLEELDGTRGGYKAGTGQMFSFGIEKAVYVNGVLEATSSLNLLQPAGGPGLVSQDSPFKLIQIGSGNPDAGKNSSAFTLPGQGYQGTIIQNSLDRQTITNITRITVGLDVLGAYRENNLSAILSQQLIRSLR